VIDSPIAVVIAGKDMGVGVATIKRLSVTIFSREHGGALGVWEAPSFCEFARLAHEGATDVLS
jgi:hypothetical protein